MLTQILAAALFSHKKITVKKNLQHIYLSTINAKTLLTCIKIPLVALLIFYEESLSAFQHFLKSFIFYKQPL